MITQDTFEIQWLSVIVVRDVFNTALFVDVHSPDGNRCSCHFIYFLCGPVLFLQMYECI
jgi:hypothetical protein